MSQLAQDPGRWRWFAKFGKSLVLGVANAGAKQRCTNPSASSMPVEHSLLMAWTGGDWGVVASTGSDWRRMVVMLGKNTIERERERERVRGLACTWHPLSLYQTKLVPVLVSSRYSAGHGWSMT